MTRAAWTGDELGFRRHCGWCGRTLRAWQLNLCRNCKGHVNDPGASAPCGPGQHWNSAPDGWNR